MIPSCNSVLWLWNGNIWFGKKFILSLRLWEDPQIASFTIFFIVQDALEYKLIERHPASQEPADFLAHFWFSFVPLHHFCTTRWKYDQVFVLSFSILPFFHTFGVIFISGKLGYTQKIKAIFTTKQMNRQITFAENDICIYLLHLGCLQMNVCD